MLNRSKLFKKLEQSTHLFIEEFSQGQTVAYTLWKALIHDQALQEKINAISSKYHIPAWYEKLGQTYTIAPYAYHYRMISVDGSQIYPDRHQGFACYLINIGTVIISYAAPSSVVVDSAPFLFTGYEEDSMPLFSQELVNCHRSELEFARALELIQDSSHNEHEPSLFLFDGSLIMWHLEGKEQKNYTAFVQKTIDVMEALFARKALHAGYISLPKSKDIVNIVRRAALIPEYHALIETAIPDILNTVLDATLAHNFLPPATRTIVFKHQTAMAHVYPEHLTPHFFYMNNGFEIIRIEVPAWIAWDTQKVDLIAQLCLDQSIKGNGYPVCLAEAHEQAVVKNSDRYFFYELMNMMAHKKGHQFPASQKSLKKRVMDI